MLAYLFIYCWNVGQKIDIFIYCSQQRKEVGTLMDEPLSWVIISICVLAHFFFSAGETALACANRFKMQVEADEAQTLGHACASRMEGRCGAISSDSRARARRQGVFLRQCHVVVRRGLWTA